MNNPIKNGVKNLGRHFTKGDLHMRKKKHEYV